MSDISEQLEKLEQAKKIMDKVDPYLNAAADKTTEFLKDSVKAGMKLESQMSSLKVVTNSSSSEMERLYSIAIKMGKTTGFSSVDASEEMERLARA